MSNNDQKLIWEAYERSHDSSSLDPLKASFARINNEWEHDVVPKIEAIGNTDLDYTEDANGFLLIYTPPLSLVSERNISLDNSVDNQIKALENDLASFFDKYKFISFEVSHQTDHAVEDAEFSTSGQWLGVKVDINALSVPEDQVDEYFRIVLAINAKMKSISMG